VKAEEFNDAVQVVRDWLPQAEAELKFRTISEDEEGILQLIENHDVTHCLLLLSAYDLAQLAAVNYLYKGVYATESVCLFVCLSVSRIRIRGADSLIVNTILWFRS